MMGNPSGKSWFRNTYATGMALILDYNQKYIDEIEFDNGNYRLPQYLHVVLSSEES